MNHYIMNDTYYWTRRESTSESLLLDQLDIEQDHLIKQSYSEQQRFIDIRPIAFHYCVKYAPSERFVPHLALAYYDRFLSRNNDIPVAIQGGGFERNLELFVFCCVIIAFRELDTKSFDFHDFVNSNQVAEESDVTKMVYLIKEGVEQIVYRLPTAFDVLILEPLISLLDMKNRELQKLAYHAHHMLFALITEDIKFTKFRPSILIASAILVAVDRLYPVLYPAFARKIFKSGYVQDVKMNPDLPKFILLANVRECIDEMKDHAIVDFVFNHDKCLPKGNVSKEQGKKILKYRPVRPYQYTPDLEHPLAFVLEDHENFVDVFRTEQQKKKQEEKEDEDKVDTSETVKEESELESERDFRQIQEFLEYV